jgi:hypothetical protein
MRESVLSGSVSMDSCAALNKQQDRTEQNRTEQTINAKSVAAADIHKRIRGAANANYFHHGTCICA